MSNKTARNFLNDTSIELLDNSEGARMVVSKQKKVAKLRITISGYNAEINSNNRKIEDKRKEIANLESTAFLKKLFSAGKIKKEIAALNAKIASLESNNKELNIVLEKLQAESDAIESEIAEYAKKLATVGLTPKDIIEEYKLILAEIEERKTKPQESVVQEEQKQETPVVQEESKKQSPAPKRKPQDYRGMSQIEKFRARQQRYEELSAEKKQPGEE